MDRFELTDAQFQRIKHMLPGRREDPGVTAADNRMFVNSVLWIARNGGRWRSLPESFGKWNSVFQRFNRWAKTGVWGRVMTILANDPDLEWLFLDSTIVRAHQHAAGAKGGKNHKLWGDRVADSAQKFTSPSTPWAIPYD